MFKWGNIMKNKILPVFLCVILLLASVMSLTAAASAEYPNEEMIRLNKLLGIIEGDSAGELGLDRSVTRAEFSKMLTVASEYKDEAVNAVNVSAGFSDVPATAWASPYIKTATAHKWIYGYSDGTFRPNDGIKLEEAATMLLRLLGYTESDMSGKYPDAQLALFDKLSLGDKLTLQRGDVLTRGDCEILFYNLMNTNTRTGQIYGTTLSLSLGSDGKVDVDKALSDKLEGPFVIEKNFAELALGGANTVFYRDGKSVTEADIRQFDAVYYIKALDTVYAYSDTVTGIYESSVLSDNIPTSVTVSGRQYGFETKEAARKMSAFGSLAEDDVVTLVLGREGKIAAAYSAEEYLKLDEDNYLEVVNGTLDGPYVVENSYSDLGLPTGGVAVRRNGAASSISEIKKYDVVYYSKLAGTLLVYSDSVSGTCMSVSPSRNLPQSVKIGSGTYTFETSEAAKSVSVLGEYKPGDLVTALLGHNGGIVKIIPMSEFAREVYGIVTSVGTEVFSDPNGGEYSTTALTLFSTEGEKLTVACKTVGISTGDAVCVSYSDGATAKKLKERSLSGEVGVNTIGDVSVSPEINVIETGANGETESVFFSRLTGARLQADDVIYYATDANGKITDLILRDFTGDGNKYGIVTTAEYSSGFTSDQEDYDYTEVNNSNYICEYQIGTQKYTLTSLVKYAYDEGPTCFVFKNGAVSETYLLASLKSTELVTDFGIMSGGKLYLYSDDITVYVPSAKRSDGLAYRTLTVSELCDNIDDYTIEAYIDKVPENGGRVRLLIARAKQH